MAVYSGYAGAQSPSSYQAQLQQASSQLQGGDAVRALASADAAIRIAPDRWDGYALAGRALLQLKRYEAAADSLSRAIERAPSSQQSLLRGLRRDSLLEESGIAVAAVPAVRLPAVAQVAPAPHRQPSTAPAAGHIRRRSDSRRVRSHSGTPVWIDASTGLMWARPWDYPAGVRGPWNFHGAQAFCSALRLRGYSDWRLPTLPEAQNVYLVSSKKWAWSKPQFDADYGLNAAMRDGTWKLPPISTNGDVFNGDRLLVWTSTAGNARGEHAALYFGRSYSVKDATSSGVSLAGEIWRNPFQGYALCVRSTQAAASP